ncbi:unnamed protein product [Moneuplotes crassus]|uniref:Uncharacterized protein n=1 Tax=Euplotes crassus TaxID=5936 RepID=A0AAD1UUZ5_EUPCR|nr:unnamed protein product [Moneuplotes crassus]
MPVKKAVKTHFQARSNSLCDGISPFQKDYDPQILNLLKNSSFKIMKEMQKKVDTKLKTIIRSQKRSSSQNETRKPLVSADIESNESTNYDKGDLGSSDFQRSLIVQESIPLFKKKTEVSNNSMRSPSHACNRFRTKTQMGKYISAFSTNEAIVKIRKKQNKCHDNLINQEKDKRKKRSQLFMKAKQIIEQQRKEFQKKLSSKYTKYIKNDKKMFEKVPPHHAAKNLCNDFLKIRKALASRTLNSKITKREIRDWNIDKVILTKKSIKDLP